MPPLKPLAYKKMKRKLEAAGFKLVSQKGSHVKFSKETDQGRRTAIVPAQGSDARHVAQYFTAGRFKCG